MFKNLKELNEVVEAYRASRPVPKEGEYTREDGFLGFTTFTLFGGGGYFVPSDTADFIEEAMRDKGLTLAPPRNTP